MGLVMIDTLRKAAFGEPASARFFCLRWIARPLLFALPIPVVAKWCDIQPSWNIFVFTLFCVAWSDCVDGIGKQDR
ncbi:hypothetical protein JQ629_34785 [Bradyrhizobium sp. AUGA SZCCT0222]|uniref:hypothetical protein n=1 Tax=Bradyrhizobium sp. AUGA SZCCT0222 TaxID=2807668 RepID=UPI001BA5EA1A|nr:hypothetical protein [Bradyrhizobium sp. AUGA SZCCT0222]MBR1272657.1 hypothetical protein [Bradyrhizobium sp. AUGA SZCCT0222]